MKAIVKCACLRAAAVILMLPATGFSLHTAHAGGTSPAPTYDVTLENLAVELAGSSLVYPKIDIKGESGKISIAEGMKAKLPSLPLKDIVAETTSIADYLNKPISEADEQTIRKFERFKQIGMTVTAFLENLRLGSSMVESYSFTETVKDPKTPLTIDVKTGKAETKGFDHSVADIRFSGGKITGTIDSLSWTGYSLLPFFREFEKILETPSAQFTSGQAHARGYAAGQRMAWAFISNLGTLSFNGLQVNATGVVKAAPETAGDSGGDITPATPETVDFTIKLKKFTLRAERPFNTIPTVFRLSFGDLQLPTGVMTLEGKAAGLRNYKNFKKVGIEQLDMSHAIDLNWDIGTKSLVVNEARLADENFGSISLKGTIGNFTETMFTSDKTVRGLSALSLLAKDISLDMQDNKGGLERMFAIVAEEDGTTPERARNKVPAALATIPEPYASMSSIQAIRKAVLAFWQNPGKLGITVKARNGIGIGVADIAAARRDPKSLDDKLDVTAAATK